MLVTKQLPVAIDLYGMEKYCWSQWLPASVSVLAFFKISSSVFRRRKKLIQVEDEQTMISFSSLKYILKHFLSNDQSFS